MGNINSLRDWGHAEDYVEMQWLMLQQEDPEDYVIATGKITSVREFIEKAAKKLNWGGINWEGEGVNEIGKRKDTNEIVIRIDKNFYRPAEVETLLGDASKAKTKLGWAPKKNIDDLINEMIESDKTFAMAEIKKNYS